MMITIEKRTGSSRTPKRLPLAIALALATLSQACATTAPAQQDRPLGEPVEVRKDPVREPASIGRAAAIFLGIILVLDAVGVGDAD